MSALIDKIFALNFKKFKVFVGGKMKPKLLILFFIQITLIVNMSFAQSLKDELQGQNRQEGIEKMRKEDEKKLAEIEKAKDSVPRHVLAGKAYQIGCNLYPTSSAGLASEELVIYRNASSYLGDLIIFDKKLFSVQGCNPREKKDTYCATRIGSVIVGDDAIEFSRSNNLEQDLQKYRGDERDISDWQFDMKSKKLYFKWKKKIYEHDRCNLRVWRD